MYGIYANIGDILMVNVTIYSSTMDPMGNKISHNPTISHLKKDSILSTVPEALEHHQEATTFTHAV